MGVRVQLEITFGLVEDVDDDGRLGLHRQVQLCFQQHHNVVQPFDDALIARTPS